nr:lipase family protein [Desulfobacula sp.]
MITGEKASLCARFAEAAYEKTDIPAGYVFKDSIKDPKTGFKAFIYEKTGTAEYIVTFTGSEDAQDFVADTALGKEQWLQNKVGVLDRLLKLDATQITFTGHSLGGGLAQYFAYDYLSAFSSDVPVVDLVTFAGFGGISGLKEVYPNDFDPTIADRLHDVANFVGCSDGLKYGTRYIDAVSRMGEGHFGGNTILTKFTDGLGVLGTHNGFPDWTDQDFMNSDAVFPAEIDYLNISGVQQLAAAIAYANHDGVITEREAPFRLVGSLLFALSSASSEEIDQLSEALPWDTLPSESIESLYPRLFNIADDPETVWNLIFTDEVIDGEVTADIRSIIKIAMRLSGSISNDIADSSQVSGEFNIAVLASVVDGIKLGLKALGYAYDLAIKTGSTAVQVSGDLVAIARKIASQEIKRVISILPEATDFSSTDAQTIERLFNLSVIPHFMTQRTTANWGPPRAGRDYWLVGLDIRLPCPANLSITAAWITPQPAHLCRISCDRAIIRILR